MPSDNERISDALNVLTGWLHATARLFRDLAEAMHEVADATEDLVITLREEDESWPSS